MFTPVHLDEPATKKKKKMLGQALDELRHRDTIPIRYPGNAMA